MDTPNGSTKSATGSVISQAKIAEWLVNRTQLEMKTEPLPLFKKSLRRPIARLALTAHLESAEAIPNSDESLLAPPSDAVMIAPARISQDIRMATERQAPPSAFGVAGSDVAA
jgi:hypothetical protein